MPINDKKTNAKKIVIEGVTETGEKFRPSDWVERMSGSLCTFNNRRIVYSPLLQPSVQSGDKCLILDPALKETNPDIYQSIMKFVQDNNLKTHEEDENNNN